MYGDSCRFSHCIAPPDSEEVSVVVQETNDLSLVSSQSVSNAWSPVGAKRRHAEKDALLELRVLSEMKELTTRAYAAMGIQSWWRGTLSRRSLNTITFPSIPEFPILAVDAVDSDAVARCARRRKSRRNHQNVKDAIVEETHAELLQEESIMSGDEESHTGDGKVDVRVQTIADADCQSGSTRGSASALKQYFSGAEVEKLLAQCAEKTAEHTAEKTAEHTAQKCAIKFENALDIAHSTYAKKLCSIQSELEQKVSEIERIEGDMKQLQKQGPSM